MAYRFGQFRKEQYKEYITPFEKIGLQEKFSEVKLAENGNFKGQKVQDVMMKRGFSTADGSLFLRFALTRFDRETGVIIKLAKENASALATDNIQQVAKITIPAAVTSEQFTVPIIYDIIITPNDDYAELIFAIDRDGKDLTETPRAWMPNVGFQVVEFGKINNVISKMNTEGTGRLKQMGVQGQPGLEMCINGEMIRVGRTGIYEINHGVDVTFLGFMPNENDHFLVDYQY